MSFTISIKLVESCCQETVLLDVNQRIHTKETRKVKKLKCLKRKPVFFADMLRKSLEKQQFSSDRKCAEWN